MPSLEYLLSPVSINEFSKNFYTKKALLIEGKQKNFGTIFSYEELNRILNVSPTPHPTLKLAKEARPVIAKTSTEIISAVKAGASLIIDQLHKYDLNVYKLAKSVSYELNEPTQVNMYLSQPDVKGFDLHYDTHDVFIVQIDGYKVWKVYNRTIEYPLFDMKTHGDSPPDNPYIDVTLAPGDVLYIPRGHWHVALATGRASLHLTLGINSRTGIDFIDWVKNELTEHAIWRKEFPFESFEDNISQNRFVHYDNLKENLIEFLNKEDTFLKYNLFCAAREKNSFDFNFPFQFMTNIEDWSGNLAFTVAPYQKMSLIKNIDETFTIYCNDCVLTFKNRAKSIVDHIFKSHSFVLSDILSKYGDINSGQIRQILKTFIDSGILSIKNC